MKIEAAEPSIKSSGIGDGDVQYSCDPSPLRDEVTVEEEEQLFGQRFRVVIRSLHPEKFKLVTYYETFEKQFRFVLQIVPDKMPEEMYYFQFITFHSKQRLPSPLRRTEFYEPDTQRFIVILDFKDSR